MMVAEFTIDVVLMKTDGSHPHFPELINTLDCHIFVDFVFTVSVFTYLYKYLHKGPDHTWFHLPSSTMTILMKSPTMTTAATSLHMKQVGGFWDLISHLKIPAYTVFPSIFLDKTFLNMMGGMTSTKPPLHFSFITSIDLEMPFSHI
jgi:hypothetical protein